MDSQLSNYSRMTSTKQPSKQQPTAQTRRNSPRYDDNTEVNQRTRSKTVLTYQKVKSQGQIKASFIQNHVRHQGTDHLYEPLRQALLIDTTQPEKKRQLQSASFYSHITKVAHVHTIEENRQLAQRTLIPQKAKLRKKRDLQNINLPDNNRYCIVNVSERRLEPISNQQLESRLSQLKVCKQSRAKNINNLSQLDRFKINYNQSVGYQQIIVYEYGSSYSNSLASDRTEGNQRFGNKMVQSRLQFDVNGQSEQRAEKYTFENTFIPSFLKERIKLNIKNKQSPLIKQTFMNMQQTAAQSSRAQIVEPLINYANRYLNLVLDSANVSLQAVKENIDCNPGQQICRPEQDFCREQTINQEYQLPFQRRKIFKGKNAHATMETIYRQNRSTQVQKYKGFISKSLTTNNSVRQSQQQNKNQAKYNFFSAIDQPVNLLLKNILKQRNSRYNQSDQRYEKPKLLDNFFCPANECITRKIQRKTTWIVPEQERAKAQLRRKNIDVETGIQFQKH